MIVGNCCQKGNVTQNASKCDFNHGCNHEYTHRGYHTRCRTWYEEHNFCLVRQLGRGVIGKHVLSKTDELQLEVRLYFSCSVAYQRWTWRGTDGMFPNSRSEAENAYHFVLTPPKLNISLESKPAGPRLQPMDEAEGQERVEAEKLRSKACHI